MPPTLRPSLMSPTAPSDPSSTVPPSSTPNIPCQPARRSQLHICRQRPLCLPLPPQICQPVAPFLGLFKIQRIN
ncbi:putative twinkle-like protein, chloroplastic/mitochondrial isoform X2 [Iris pallida]|uniref:Twinkle-like protein, chloroplastic/mitochondrial isoform X2 n=1 Tax=Iris pallida TaxID=29817 RepID=A0AAX6HRC8_IRIPA|nr:putative twinkle-like protein, chloroplastic/mitochondrial isoform X2 [Iris pallida]